MSRRVGTPVNQVKLSSVSVVRLTRKGLKFEVAAYPSKVVDYRAGVEADLDEVLQIASVFKNVEQGVLAPKKDLAKAFPKQSTEDACREILKHGSLQVSEAERKAASANLFRDVAAIVAARVVDARTGLALPPASIERVLRDELHLAPSGTRSAKAQALEAIKVLERDHGFKRAPMALRVNAGGAADAVVAALEALAIAELTAAAAGAAVDVVAPPSAYRAIQDAVKAATGGAAQAEVVDRAARVAADAPPPPGGADAAPPRPRPPRPPAAAAAPAPAPPGRKAPSCTTCGGSFADAAAHRAHFKSEWHRHNLSRKLEMARAERAFVPIDEATFDEERQLEEGG